MDMNGQSAARRAFAHYLRTGRRLPSRAFEPPLEAKFNPYHDPRNGQFTFAPGGPRSLSRVIISDRRRPIGPRLARQSGAIAADAQSRGGARQSTSEGMLIDGVYRLDGNQSPLKPAQYRPPPPRGGMGGNIRSFYDPMTLQQAFPALSNAPGGMLLPVADNFLDLTGPANRLTTALAQEKIDLLVRQIQAVNPSYRLESLGFPQTLEGQLNQINNLRLERAAAVYRFRGEPKPLQVETLRFLQRNTDIAYERGLRLLRAGRLDVRLSPQEALGNYVDRQVREKLRQVYNRLGISTGRDSRVRVNSREYDRSGNDATYRIPDARVGKIAYDVTLTLKVPTTPQVRGFFRADFKPDIVAIIRPRQLGPESSYIITRPR